MLRSGARAGSAVAAAVGLLAAAGCSGAIDKAGGTKPARVITLSVLNTRGLDELQPFTDRVAALSGATLRVSGAERWGRGSATAEIEAIRAVQAGKADLAVVPARAWHEAGATSFDALVAPLAVDSMALQERVLSGDLPAQMLAGVTPLGLTGIGILPGPMRKPAGITRALRGPADYRGVKIGYSPSAVGDRALRAIGATPVASPFEGEDVSAYDAIEQQVESVAGNGYDGAVRSITANVNLWPRPLVVAGNAQALRRLTDQQLAWLRRAAGDVLGSSAQAGMKRETEATALLCARAKLKFVSAGPDQIAQLRSAFQPVYSWLRQDQQTSRFLDQIEALRAGVQPLPQESAPRCAPAQATGASASAAAPAGRTDRLDGTYRMDVSQEQWRTADPERHPENWGTFVYVLSGGRFATTQENPDACTWAYGTYRVDGDRLDWSFVDGGGIAPDHAQNKPGEKFVFRWSRYHGTLTLTPISPADLGVSQWRQLSTTPSGSALSTRCPPPAQARNW
jgi:TRAP-type C4-dicarboxylate transport system substrate-binding protein